jgi:outer membrane protein OmpA-like peptidoglycan-associated protein
MGNRSTAATWLLIGGLLAAPAVAQEPAGSSSPQPLFRITVVGRTTPTVNYRPRRGETWIDFKGTALMPNAEGKAKIEGEQGYIEIEADFDKVRAPQTFGPEYLTYVVWAVTPEGRANNLGELQIRGDDGHMQVTTELQAFALIVTAEPYFAVTQPSDVVVMENVLRGGVFNTEGRIETVEAKYELLRRGGYLMNRSAADLKIKPLEPGSPLDLAQARNAVELARWAGADRFAPDTFTKAAGLLAEAERAREQRKGGNQVQQPARQAVQTAEDARIIALQKQEEAYNAAQRAQLAQAQADAEARAREEAMRRQQADAERASADAARVAADQARQAAERERLDAERQRLDAERQRADAEAQRLAAERAKQEADAATAQANAARAAADQARLAAEAQAAQARDAAARAQQEREQLRADLLKQLNIILETRETARGLIVNLSDVLFDTAKATLKPGAREKLSKISGILLSHPGLEIAVEGHADSRGSESYNQQLSEARASSVRDYLVREGIAPGTVATSGFGETQPVASNDTAAGRQQNRRVELIVSGAPIGR